MSPYSSSSSSSPAPSIAIIGAGPCGLTLARLLEQKGITNYVVYERGDGTPEDLSRSGGSLDLHGGTGQLALRECGLYSEFEKHARWHDQTFRIAGQDGVVCMDLGEVAAEAAAASAAEAAAASSSSSGGSKEEGHRDGQEKKQQGEEENNEEEKGRDAPEIDRGALRQILLDSVPREKIRWGHGLAEVVVSEEGDCRAHSLRFTNGEVASGFKLIVGTDGAWSKVRAALTPIKPRYSGRHILELSIRKTNPIYDTVAAYAQSGMLACLGPKSKTIMVQRQGDLSYRVYVCLETDEEDLGRPKSGSAAPVLDLSNPEACKEILLSSPPSSSSSSAGTGTGTGTDPRYCFGDWAENLKDLIRHTETFRDWSLYYMPVEGMKGWNAAAKGITVAGDAAHLTLPNGEGVNIAMVDAMELVKRIVVALSGGDDDLSGAARDYERDMVERAIPHIEDGLHMNKQLSHEENPKHFCDFVRAGLLH